jgi:hypothetical protein
VTGPDGSRQFAHRDADRVAAGDILDKRPTSIPAEKLVDRYNRRSGGLFVAQDLAEFLVSLATGLVALFRRFVTKDLNVSERKGS